MSNPIEGEPAFPNGPHGGEIHYDDGHVEHQYPGSEGLSERRYYIGQALQGFCTNTSFMVDTSYEAIAAMAIQQADAVMALLYPAEADVGSSSVQMVVSTDRKIKTTIDHRFLAEFLRSVDPTASVDVHLSEPDRPVKLVAGDLVCVIMPMSRS